MDLEIRHLRLVQAISQEGSMTRAAVRLHLTQSALSHQLRGIEDRLNTLLFHRVGRRMTLTAAGEKLLRSAESLLRDLARLEGEVRQLSTCSEGVLRLAVECNTCYHWMPLLLKAYRRRHPKVGIEVEVEAAMQPLQSLLDGKLDVALVTRYAEHPNVLARPLFEDEFVAVMSPDHALARRPFLTAEDFADETLIIFPPRKDSTVFQRLLDPAGVEPRRLMSVPLTDAILQMVRAGIGISVLTEWAVAPELRSRSVAAVRLTPQGVFRRWHALTLNSPALAPYVRDFAALLAEQPFPGRRGLRQRHRASTSVAPGTPSRRAARP